MNTSPAPRPNAPTAQWLSLACDAQIDADALQACLAGQCDASHHNDWDAYQLVGRALRHELHDLSAHDPVFLQKLHSRMAADAIYSVAAHAIQTGDSAGFDQQNLAQRSGPAQPQAANDARWRLWASALAMAGLLIGLWTLGGLGRDAQPLLAQVSPADPSVSAPQGVWRDAQLDALLAAHQRQAVAVVPQPDGLLRAAVLEAQP